MRTVILRSTGPQNNPSHFTPEFCERLRDADPVAYQTDVLGEFADPESGLLSPVSLRRNTREAPLELVPDEDASYGAAVDLAEGSAIGNAVTLVIVEAWEDDNELPRFRVALAREWRGLNPDGYWSEIAHCCGRFGIEDVTGDQYAASANQDIATRHGITLWISRTSATSKLEDFTNLATLVHADRVELPPDRTFRRDLQAVKKRTTQQGHSIVLPRTGDGRHCDYAPALATAVRVAAQAAELSNVDMSLVTYRSPTGWNTPSDRRF